MNQSQVVATEIIDVALGVLSLWFFVVNYPVVLVDDVFIEKLLSLLQVKHYEPLVCETVELHFMFHFPVVETTAYFYFSVSWTSVMKSKLERLLAKSNSIEMRHNTIDLVKSVVLILFIRAQIKLLENLLLFILSENLLNNAQGHVV